MMILKTDKTIVVIMFYYSEIKGKLVSSLPHLNILRKDLKIKKSKHTCRYRNLSLEISLILSKKIKNNKYYKLGQ